MNNDNMINEEENVETNDLDFSEKENEIDEFDNKFNDDVFTYSVDNNNIENDYDASENNKSFLYLIIGVVILVLIILLIVFLVNKGNSKNSSFSSIESKMVKGANDYYKKHSDLLPVVDGGMVTVSADDLVKSSNLKPFSEMTKKDVSCSGYVNVYKNGEFYSYYPHLDCGDSYKTQKFNETIIKDSYVESGDGLYKYDDEYIFRGEYPNNYVVFDEKTWRIIKINSNGSIKLFSTEEKLEKFQWDNRYNSSNNSYSGINDFNVSRMLEFLNKLYEEDKVVSKNNKKYLVKNNWCIGKIGEENTSLSSLNICDSIYSDLYIGSLEVKDVLIPSINPKCDSLYGGECTNYNYFFNVSSSWTMNASSDKSFNVFYTSGGAVSYAKASSTKTIIPVINLNGDILFKSGDGSADNPYVLGE